jgi:dolichol-phosphate mannosyltransferase
LRLALALGFSVSALSILAGVLAVIFRATGVYLVSGWASIVVGMSFLGGVQLTVLGVMGTYIASIHEEVKRRPLYLVRDRVGGDGVSATPRVPGSSFTDAGEAIDR